MQKKIQVLADPVVNFFEMHLIQHFFLEMKKLSFQKNYKYGIKAPIKLYFSFPKKLQVLDQVHFKKKLQQLDQPTLVFFFHF